MEFALPPEILDIQARARALVDEHLIPEERALSRSHKLPAKTQARLAKLAAAAAPLAERQSIQWMLVDMHLHLNQLRLMTYATAAAHDRGEDVRYDSYMCKYFGDESSFAAADRCMQIFGGLGLTTDTPIETFWRDQRSMIITEGSTEVLKQSLAREILARFKNEG